MLQNYLIISKYKIFTYIYTNIKTTYWFDFLSDNLELYILQVDQRKPYKRGFSSSLKKSIKQNNCTNRAFHLFPLSFIYFLFFLQVFCSFFHNFWAIFSARVLRVEKKIVETRIRFNENITRRIFFLVLRLHAITILE